MRVAIGESASNTRASSFLIPSGPRQKTLAGVGDKNADADHGKQCSNDLDHDDGPLRPAQTKRHGGPHSQKKSLRHNGVAV
jgi:hypothetical protein